MLAGLLEWYEPRGAAYPWRGWPDPYRVLVSEVMLQQTQAARVVPAFERFVARFPTVRSLAAAPIADVIRAWTGLGYNRRAVALSNAARAIVRDHGGRVPDDPVVLRELPGVGQYTADAVASLAYGRPVPAVDTNVRRVIARAVLGRQPEDVPVGAVRAAARLEIDEWDPGGWNQAVMDLGREICRTAPRCHECPLAGSCRFRREGHAARGRTRAGSAFEGSTRQLRGRVIAELAEGPRTLGALVARTGQPARPLAATLSGLVADGLVEASPSALAGRRRGRVWLAEDATESVTGQVRSLRLP
jgi:A/G-specific adenine glycosylase